MSREEALDMTHNQQLFNDNLNGKLSIVLGKLLSGQSIAPDNDTASGYHAKMEPAIRAPHFDGPRIHTTTSTRKPAK